MYFPNLDAFDAFLEEVVQEIEQEDEDYDSDDDLKKFGRWLDNFLSNDQEQFESQELKLQDEEFNPEGDLEELERLLAEGSDEEQELAELQEPSCGLTITTTWFTVLPVCVSKHGLTIPTLEKVLNHDPFMISIQPVPTLVKILGLYELKLVWPIFEAKSQILQIGPPKKILNATDGLALSLLEVY